MNSPMAPRAGPTTGVPQAIASAVASENVSVPLVSTATSLAPRAAATSAGRSRYASTLTLGRAAAKASMAGRDGPLPMKRSRAPVRW